MTKRSNPDSPTSVKATVTEEFLTKMQENYTTLAQDIKSIKHDLSLANSAQVLGTPKWFFDKMSTNLQGASRSDPSIPTLAYSSFLVREAAKATEKSFNAVIEKLPDSVVRNNDTHEVLPSDGTFINAICEKGGLAKPTSFWRQPSKNPKNPRVIKVHFDSTKDRNNFIFNFRKNLPALPDQPRLPTCRRDMTVPELNLLYSLRKECYNANCQVGQMKYYVKDLDIAELSTPRPLNTPRKA